MQNQVSLLPPPRQRHVVMPYVHPAIPPVPAVHIAPAIGCMEGQGGGGEKQPHVVLPMKPRHRQTVWP